MSGLRKWLTTAKASRLSSTRGRKLAGVYLVAIPLVLSFVAGLIAEAITQSLSFPLIGSIVATVLVAGLAWFAARRIVDGARTIRTTQRALWITEKIAPITVEVSKREPERINIIHPAIDLKHFFGGFITVFSLARRLLERGHRVRLVTLEGLDLPGDWREQLSAYQGIGDSIHRLEVFDASDRSIPVRMNAADRLLATHWTAAHVASRAAEGLETNQFCYLIQEFEPFIFPLGSAAVLAEHSYELPHTAIFSSELLQDYFATIETGVFAVGPVEGRENSVAIRNAITPIGPVGAEELRHPGKKRLIFYARPEEHAARNLFEIGTMALDKALAGGHFSGWEICAIGNVDLGHGTLTLPESGVALTLIPRETEARYAETLKSADVGLSLMGTPHPSLVPIEMASAGLVTVTNIFENKDEAALTAISGNLLAARRSVIDVAAALVEAEIRSQDLEARARNSEVDWPSSWGVALDEEKMEAIEALLETRP